MNASDDRIVATYLIETPLDPAHVADVLAGEQSSGTFVRVAGETDDLRARSRATVRRIELLDDAPAPSLRSAWLERHGTKGPWRRARITVAFPPANVGRNLPTLAATVAGNLYDLGETTGVRLEHLSLPASFRERFERPKHGVAGTRASVGVASGPIVGTIVKPNVGMGAGQTADLIESLCRAGIDFVKDDEVHADSEHAPIADRIRAVMDRVRRWRDESGKDVMVAFNVSGDHDDVLRHAELVQREGGSCVMASLNWVGFSTMQALRRHTDLAIHGHRNGFGMFERHPALGMGFQPYQAMWRLAGVDHMHVHGMAGKFAQSDDDVAQGARDCLAPLADPDDAADVVLPAFSSGQWAGTLPLVLGAVPTGDALFLCGGGILAHPGGPAAGVASVRQAWAASRAGRTLQDAARDMPELRDALAFFGK